MLLDVKFKFHIEDILLTLLNQRIKDYNHLLKISKEICLIIQRHRVYSNSSHTPLILTFLMHIFFYFSNIYVKPHNFYNLALNFN